VYFTKFLIYRKFTPLFRSDPVSFLQTMEMVI